MSDIFTADCYKHYQPMLREWREIKGECWQRRSWRCFGDLSFSIYFLVKACKSLAFVWEPQHSVRTRLRESSQSEINPLSGYTSIRTCFDWRSCSYEVVSSSPEMRNSFEDVGNVIQTRIRGMLRNHCLSPSLHSSLQLSSLSLSLSPIYPASPYFWRMLEPSIVEATEKRVTMF